MIRKCLCLPVFCLAGAACLAFSSCEMDIMELYPAGVRPVGDGERWTEISDWTDLNAGNWSGGVITLTTLGEIKECIGVSNFIDVGNGLDKERIKTRLILDFNISKDKSKIEFDCMFSCEFYEISKANVRYLENSEKAGNFKGAFYNSSDHSIAMWIKGTYSGSGIKFDKLHIPAYMIGGGFDVDYFKTCIFDAISSARMNEDGNVLLLTPPPPLDSIGDVVMRLVK